MAQEIRVFVKGVEYPIWVKAKRGKALHDELGGKPVNFRCELTDEVIPVDLGVDVGPGSGLLGTSCKWDSIERIGN